MCRTTVRAALARAALIGILVLAGGAVVGGSAAAAAPAPSSAATMSGDALRGTATPDSGGMGHVCPPTYLCVHETKDFVHYHWYDYQACGYEHPIHGFATWYVNNQTKGTAGLFYFSDGTWAFTQPAYFSGRPPTRGAFASYVQPC